MSILGMLNENFRETNMYNTPVSYITRTISLELIIRWCETSTGRSKLLVSMPLLVSNIVTVFLSCMVGG